MSFLLGLFKQQRSHFFLFRLISMKKTSNKFSFMFNHGTIIRTVITYKKIRCYMRDSACRWLIVENCKIFRSYVKHFFHVKEIVESWLAYVNKFSWIAQSCFLTHTIKIQEKIVPALFSYFLELFWRKYIF